jgi:acetate kinase
MRHESVLASGVAEKIGEPLGNLTHEISNASAAGESKKTVFKGKIDNHQKAFVQIADLLVNPEDGVINDKSAVAAVGHRVVHGGEAFHSTTLIDDDVMAAIEENIPLAPLHNPPNLTGIQVARSIFPDAAQVAVFDTAFHQTLPAKAFMYPLPFWLYQKERVRRYGFHGTSHHYVAEKCANYLKRSLFSLNLITVHLGNGASIAAIKKGRCVDTSMGMTPLEGLVMGTRCGDIDPAIPFFLANHLKMSFKDIDRLLNKKSGLLGLCGTNDMREVIEKKQAGDEKAALALEVYCYRIKKYVGAYIAALGNLDALVFTAGIGENSPDVRMLACEGLDGLGIAMDPRKNETFITRSTEVNSSASKVKVLVIPTDEELKIAQETQKIITP